MANCHQKSDITHKISDDWNGKPVQWNFNSHSISWNENPVKCNDNLANQYKKIYNGPKRFGALNNNIKFNHDALIFSEWPFGSASN